MNPQWTRDYLNKEFSSGLRMEADGQAWCRDAHKWMHDFLVRMGASNREVSHPTREERLAATEGMVYSKGHYEWSMFAWLNGQCWYFSSSDCRYKIMKSLLVRKCDGFNDFVGSINQWVNYDSPNFEWDLQKILTR